MKVVGVGVVAVEMEMEEAKVKEKTQVMVEELRAGFKSGRTKERAWRLEQLNGIVRMIAEQEAQLLDALAADLGKPAHEAFITEVCHQSTTITTTSSTNHNSYAFLLCESNRIESCTHEFALKL